MPLGSSHQTESRHDSPDRSLAKDGNSVSSAKEENSADDELLFSFRTSNQTGPGSGRVLVDARVSYRLVCALWLEVLLKGRFGFVAGARLGA